MPRFVGCKFPETGGKFRNFPPVRSIMRAILVAGLGFGDEGKGSITDYLCRKYESKLVVRYNGGAQSAHNVVLADGRHHCFSQWGSGTFAGAKTYLSRYMLVNPTFMLPEGEHLVSLGVTDAFEKMFIDYNALVTTPFHVSLNRFRETSRRASSTLEYGTCGMGIGETVDRATRYPEWAIRMRDFSDLNTLTGKLEMLRTEVRREVYDLTRTWSENKGLDLDYDILEDPDTVDRFISTTQRLLKRGVTVVKPLNRDFAEDFIIFEGAQGVLLDEEWGFHPHTTWSNCTFDNALKIVKQFSGTKGAKVTRLGVTRSYHTRHGAGPLPSERDDGLEIKDHNTKGEWQGSFRLGYFDFVMARYARFIIEGLDGIAINHLDQVSGPQKVCIAHNFQGYDQHRINFGIDHETHLGLEEMSKSYGEEAEPVQSVVSAVYTELGSVNRLTQAISRVFKAPLTIIGYGPTAEDKRDV